MTGDALPGRLYRLETPQPALDDLHRRLEATRFPDQQAGADWETGTPIAYMRRLREHWLGAFDWRSWEARINRFPQRMIEVEGVSLHILIEQGSGPQPTPLILTHGWPGTFVEFLDIIEPLAHPERHGGRVEQAFTVIVPSLPGYGLSPAPDRPIPPDAIAPLWRRLMREEFGFERYLAYGSDWGSLVAATLARSHADGLAGILITTPGGRPAPDAPIVPTPDEATWLQLVGERMQGETAYQMVQATKPQTLAYAQSDSPIGLAAWITEKFQGWTEYGSGREPPIAIDTIIANTMFYWLNGALAPSWLYMGLGQLAPLEAEARPAVPAGFLLAPEDCFAPAPRSWLERFWTVASYCVDGVGHFPGFDSPETLVRELRAMLEWSRPAGADQVFV